MLLGSLLEEFESFTVAIESRDEIPSVSNLKVKLLEEEARQLERDSPDKEKKSETNNEALLTKLTNLRANKNKNSPKQQKFSGKCYECGKIGHKGTDCYMRKRREARKTDDAIA